MARARNIKPALFKNELLGVADPLITLLFESLWCLADREGRLEDRPLRIKAETFPYREGLDINGYLTWLQRMDFIIRYTVNGQALIQIVNFKKHQAPHNTEKASELPPIEAGTLIPCGSQEITVNTPLSHGEKTEALPPDSFNLIPDSLVLNPDSQIPVNTIVKQKSLDGDAGKINEIFEYWQKTMNSPKSVLDANRKGLIVKALKNYSAADICKAISGCSKSPHNMGKNPQNTKYNGLDLILRNAEKIDRFIALDAGNAVASNETMAERNERITREVLGHGNFDDGNTIDMEA